YIDNEQGRTPFALVWDATEQMAAEKMQLQHEQRLQSLIDSMQEGVISIDQRGIILSFNPAAGQMFGYEAVDVIGTKVNRLMPAEYAKTYDDYLQRYLNGGETHIFGIPRELKAVRANGQEFPIRLLVSEVVGTGPERQFVGSVTDLSEVVLREEMLRRSQKMEAVGQLSGGIAHDFNNQLGVVLGYLDFLGEELRHQEKPSQWVDTATRAARRCVELTRQLLAFSRRRVLDESQVLDVNATIEEMQGLIQRSLTPGIELDLRLAAGCWRVRCDRGELQDVLLNLALNARDAMPDGGALRIQSENQAVEVIGEASGGVLEPGEYVHLVVEDSGTGMTDEALEHLFEPFFTTKPEGEGTGLGMAMVWGFVQRSGGQINVSSQPGQGTRVSIYLPRCRPESGLGLSAAEMPEPPGAALPRGTERVLVVDDEPMLRELASSYLQHLGYRTLEAENGRQALAILASDERLDLVFSDVIMPGGVDGFAVAEAARQRQLPPKVLLASGFLGQGNDRDRAGQLAGALLDKPYDIAALARAVRRVLDD
ncbi:MAG: PAS domain S-box protein, partial [Gammaproteobacteria bacterium]|nr:PAS domain S-box protein [Gammaproteobacteria bacterium]